jgi:branched-chain amino acid aminotransferase
MLSGNKLTTPPISEGCLNGIMRKQLLLLVKSIDDFEIVEEPISPFELQKADELFITNVITGIQPITKYRKKVYESQFAERILKKLNTMLFN